MKMIRCSPEAFAKCPTRALCGNLQEATFTEGSECDLFNQSIADSPLTNADAIRCMSDDDLAEFLFSVMKSTLALCGVATPAHIQKATVWLQQPMEVPNVRSN